MKLRSLLMCAFALTGGATSMLVDALDVRVMDIVIDTENSRKARQSLAALASLASKDSVDDTFEDVLKATSPLLPKGVKKQLRHTHMARHFAEIPDNFLEGQRNIKGKNFGKHLKSLLGKFNPKATVTPGNKVLVGLEQALSSTKIKPAAVSENEDQIGEWVLAYEMMKAGLRGTNMLRGGDSRDVVTSELALRFLKSVVLRINAAAIDEDEDDSMTSGEERLTPINLTDEDEVKPQYSQAWYATDFLQRLAMDAIRFAGNVEAEKEKEEKASDSTSAEEEEEEESSEHSDAAGVVDEKAEKENVAASSAADEEQKPVASSSNKKKKKQTVTSTSVAVVERDVSSSDEGKGKTHKKKVHKKKKVN